MSDRLKKLFRLLGSDNDNEALAALRAIKKAVVTKERNWTKFVDEMRLRA